MALKSGQGKKVLAAAGTGAISLLTYGSPSLILGTIGGLASGMAANYLGSIDLFEKEPELLDDQKLTIGDDLEKLVVKSVVWSVLNIRKLYERELYDKSKKKELAVFTTELIEEINSIKSGLFKNGKRFFKEIENTQKDQRFLNKFDLDFDNFPDIDQQNSFRVFFKKRFVNNLKMSFSELLKQKENNGAYIDYQKDVYSQITNGVEKLIKQNKQVIGLLIRERKEQGKIDYTKKRQKNLEEIKESISFDEAQIKFQNEINQTLNELKKDTEYLIELSCGIQDEIDQVHQIVKDFSIVLNESWVQKNKVKVLIAFAVLLVVVSILAVKIIYAPFQLKVDMKVNPDIEVHPFYPAQSNQAWIKFYLYDIKKKEVSYEDQIILPELASSFNGQKCKVELIGDPYWKLSNDSIIIKKDGITLFVQPNEQLGVLKGEVRTRNNQEPIEGAIVRMETVSGLTDSDGNFTLKIPIELRRDEYPIRVEKEGFVTKSRPLLSGANAEIRLNKLKENE